MAQKKRNAQSLEKTNTASFFVLRHSACSAGKFFSLVLGVTDISDDYRL
jgi:hypothetical protein